MTLSPDFYLYEGLFLFFATFILAICSLYLSYPFVTKIYPHLRHLEEYHWYFVAAGSLIAGIFLATKYQLILSPTYPNTYRSYCIIATSFLIALALNKNNLFRLLYLLPLYYAFHEFIYETLANLHYGSVPFVGIVGLSPFWIVANFWQPVAVLIVLRYHKFIVKLDTYTLACWSALTTYLLFWFFYAHLISDVPPFLVPNATVNPIGAVWSEVWTLFFTLTFFFTFCRNETTTSLSYRIKHNPVSITVT
jgi:hypothetical protein